VSSLSIVPVYKGTFRIVQREVVLEDIRRQVAAGAQHITFGDPTFSTGRSRDAVVEASPRASRALLRRTIKVEHLLKHAGRLPALRETDGVRDHGVSRWMTTRCAS